MTSYSTLPAIVIDANVAIRAILPRSERGVILERFAAWQQSRREFFAPELLLSEAVSVIRRAIFNHWITEQEGRIAVEDVFRLGIEIIPSDARICQSALDWAGRLGG